MPTYIDPAGAAPVIPGTQATGTPTPPAQTPAPVIPEGDGATEAPLAPVSSGVDYVKQYRDAQTLGENENSLVRLDGILNEAEEKLSPEEYDIFSKGADAVDDDFLANPPETPTTWEGLAEYGRTSADGFVESFGGIAEGVGYITQNDDLIEIGQSMNDFFGTDEDNVGGLGGAGAKLAGNIAGEVVSGVLLTLVPGFGPAMMAAKHGLKAAKLTKAGAATGRALDKVNGITKYRAITSRVDPSLGAGAVVGGLNEGAEAGREYNEAMEAAGKEIDPDERMFNVMSSTLIHGILGSADIKQVLGTVRPASGAVEKARDLFTASRAGSAIKMGSVSLASDAIAHTAHNYVAAAIYDEHPDLFDDITLEQLGPSTALGALVGAITHKKVKAEILDGNGLTAAYTPLAEKDGSISIATKQQTEGTGSNESSFLTAPSAARTAQQDAQVQSMKETITTDSSIERIYKATTGNNIEPEKAERLRAMMAGAPEVFGGNVMKHIAVDFKGEKKFIDTMKNLSNDTAYMIDPDTKGASGGTHSQVVSLMSDKKSGIYSALSKDKGSEIYKRFKNGELETVIEQLETAAEYGNPTHRKDLGRLAEQLEQIRSEDMIERSSAPKDLAGRSGELRKHVESLDKDQADLSESRDVSIDNVRKMSPDGLSDAKVSRLVATNHLDHNFGSEGGIRTFLAKAGVDEGLISEAEIKATADGVKGSTNLTDIMKHIEENLGVSDNRVVRTALNAEMAKVAAMHQRPTQGSAMGISPEHHMAASMYQAGYKTRDVVQQLRRHGMPINNAERVASESGRKTDDPKVKAEDSFFGNKLNRGNDLFNRSVDVERAKQDAKVDDLINADTDAKKLSARSTAAIKKGKMREPRFKNREQYKGIDGYIAKKAKQIQQGLSTAGKLAGVAGGKAVNQKIQTFQASKNSIKKQVQTMDTRFDLMVKEATGKPYDKMSDQDKLDLSAAIGGKPNENASVHINAVGRAWRAEFDANGQAIVTKLAESQALIERMGANPGTLLGLAEQADRIVYTMGTYTRRIYTAFDDPKGHALAILADEKRLDNLYNMALKENYDGAVSELGKAKADVHGMLADLRDTTDTQHFMQQLSQAGQVSGSALHSLQDLDEWQISLLDPKTDAKEIAMHTMHSQRTIIETMAFQNSMMDTAHQMGLATMDPDSDVHPTYGKMPEVLNRDVSLFAEARMAPEMRAAITDSVRDNQASTITEVLNGTTNLIKMTSTVMRLATGVRNVMGSHLVGINNGVWPGDRFFVESEKALAKYYTDTQKGIIDPEYDALQKAGILGSNTFTRSFNDEQFDNDSRLQERYTEVKPEGYIPNAYAWASKAAAGAKHATIGLYQYSDDRLKLQMYKKRYEQASEKLGLSHEESQKWAIDQVLDEVPSGYRQANILNKVSSPRTAGDVAMNWALSSFVSYPAGIVRSQTTKVAKAVRNMRSGSPELASLGRQELAHMAIGQAIMVVGVDSIARAMMDDGEGDLPIDDLSPEERAERSALSQRMSDLRSPWSKASGATLNGIDPDTGNMMWFNWHYVNPMSTFHQPLMTLAFGAGSAEENGKEAAFQFAKEFAGFDTNMSVQFAADMVTDFKAVLDNPNAETITDMGDTVAGALVPGTYLDLNKIHNATENVDSPTYQTDLKNSILKAGGLGYEMISEHRAIDNLSDSLREHERTMDYDTANQLFTDHDINTDFQSEAATYDGWYEDFMVRQESKLKKTVESITAFLEFADLQEAHNPDFDFNASFDQMAKNGSIPKFMLEEMMLDIDDGKEITVYTTYDEVLKSGKLKPHSVTDFKALRKKAGTTAEKERRGGAARELRYNLRIDEMVERFFNNHPDLQDDPIEEDVTTVDTINE